MIQSVIKFGLMTGISAALNIGMAVTLHEIVGVSEKIAVAVALVCVFFLNFFLMRYYVYGEKTGSGWRQFGVYAPAAAGFRGLEYASFYVGHSVLALPWLWIFIGVLVLSAGMKFFFYRLVFASR